MFLYNTVFCLLFSLIQKLKAQLFVDKFSEEIAFSFLDYIFSGFELNFMVAVDFTGHIKFLSV